MRLLSAFGSDRLSDFWGIVREIDPGVIEREASRSVKIVLCGTEGAGQRLLAAHLCQNAKVDDAVDVFDMPRDVPVALPSADAYIYVARGDQVFSTIVRDHLWQLSKRSGTIMCVVDDPRELDGDSATASVQQIADRLSLPSDHVMLLSPDDRREIESDFAPWLFAQAPHLALPAGVKLPLVRSGAATQIIRETSRVNAEFVAMTALPGLIPLIGGIAAVGADMVVLTKNQAMMLVKLATIHDRATNNRWQLLSEIAPVVGAAFLWRSAARSLVSLLPTPLSIAPRVGVAYVGTFVVGRVAAYYYELGRRPSPELIDSFAREATSQFGILSPVLADLRRLIPLL